MTAISSSKMSKGQKSLEMANQMYKDAFLVKKTKFTRENPKLNEAEIECMTAHFFSQIGVTRKEK